MKKKLSFFSHPKNTQLQIASITNTAFILIISLSLIILLPGIISARDFFIANGSSSTVGIFDTDNDELTLIQNENINSPNWLDITDDGRLFVVNSPYTGGLPNVLGLETDGFGQDCLFLTGEGSNPVAVECWESSQTHNRAHVSNALYDSLFIINLDNNEISYRVHTGKSPSAMINYDNKLFVACNGDWGNGYSNSSLDVYSLDDYSLMHREALNAQGILNPNHLIEANNKIYVSCTGDYATINGGIVVLNSESFAVESIINFDCFIGKIAYYDGKLFVCKTSFSGDVGIIIYDLENEEIIETIPSISGFDIKVLDNVLYVLDSGNFFDTPGKIIEISLDDYSILSEHTLDGCIGSVSFCPVEPGMDINTDYSIKKNAGNLINYPNPFNPVTTIKYNIQAGNAHNIRIYNTKGQVVKTWTNLISHQATNTLIWQGDNNQNESVSGGIYFINIESEGKIIASRKAVLIK